MTAILKYIVIYYISTIHNLVWYVIQKHRKYIHDMYVSMVNNCQRYNKKTFTGVYHDSMRNLMLWKQLPVDDMT